MTICSSKSARNGGCWVLFPNWISVNVSEYKQLDYELPGFIIVGVDSLCHDEKHVIIGDPSACLCGDL